MQVFYIDERYFFIKRVIFVIEIVKNRKSFIKCTDNSLKIVSLFAIKMKYVQVYNSG